MIKVYNKLVRDKIPEIIEASGKKAEIRIAGDAEYKDLLGKKLLEEVDEFLESNDPEELADIVEVVKALGKIYGITFEKILGIAENKKAERGGFDKKMVLICVQQQDKLGGV